MLKSLDITAFYVCNPYQPRPYIQIVSPDLEGLNRILNTAYATMIAMQKMQNLTVASACKNEKPEPGASIAHPSSPTPSPSARFYQPAAAVLKESAEISATPQNGR